MIVSLESRESAAAEYIHAYGDALRRISQADAWRSGPADQGAASAAAGFQEEFNSLNRELLKAEESVERDIPVRIEAVFLPYKASMWDSLESVWRAAEEDENCDAFVIPIPYYDKNPDGSFREEHYEGDQYPGYVPVTHYNQYDFANRHPDMIFIHNPYDEQNYVTSVHPFFYSKNLKQFTDLLVYIPYFILEEPDIHDELSRKSIKGFCIMPGVLYADRVIVQSDKMRQVYVDLLTEFMGAGQGSRKYWEEKILGLGSPKVDKALGTRKGDLEIPEEWLKIIRKPDGSWKRIVFYNTSVTALLQYDQRMLRKLENVFCIMKGLTEDIALLWRPHPLAESTLQSMRPGLWQEYKKIRDLYRQEGWGIYDCTANMNRAVALSDAYYGDMSSLVHLYEQLSKPVMIQNCDTLVRKKDRDIFIWTEDMIVDEEKKLWFFHGMLNMLCSYDVSTDELKIMGKVPSEKNFEKRLYSALIKKNDCLIGIPGFAREMVVYNRKNGEFQKIPMKTEVSGSGNKFLFRGAFVFENWLYLIPNTYQNILKYSLATFVLEKEINWKNELKTMKNCDSFFLLSPIQMNEHLFAFTVALQSCFFICDMSSDTIRKLELEDKKCQITAITFLDDCVYLYDTYNHQIIKWLLSKGTEVKRSAEFTNEKLKSSSNFALNVIGEKYIMADSVDQDIVALFNTDLEVVKTIEPARSYLSKEVSLRHGVLKSYGKDYYIYIRFGHVTIFNEHGILYEKELRLFELERERFLNEETNMDIPVNLEEVGVLGIENWIQAVSKESHITDKKQDTGFRIYRQLGSEL
ncbi:MAG: hypothetical protein LUH21_26370 [Clostridiales bacterium]|nr:hypothetical protein [Clostridiales bacterium]